MTGAAGAIGGAVAEQLLRNGASVCICDIGGSAVQIMGGEKRDGAQALEERRDELAAATGGDVMSAVCDVTNLEQIEAMMAAVESVMGGSTSSLTSLVSACLPMVGCHSERHG